MYVNAEWLQHFTAVTTFYRGYNILTLSSSKITNSLLLSFPSKNDQNLALQLHNPKTPKCVVAHRNIKFSNASQSIIRLDS